MNTETQTIKCPECGTIQQAKVSFVPLIGWGNYIHDCINCGYTITESEWEQVEPEKSKE